MKKKKNLLVLAFSGILIALLAISCSENGGTGPGSNNWEKADSLANEAFDELNDAILDAEEPEDPHSGDDIFSEETYNNIKAKFQEALQADVDNALAHLGMSVLEIASINYDDELWDMINDIRDEFGDKRIFNNQFNFLIKTPEIYPTYLTKALKDNTISFARVQNFIDDNIMPKLDNAIDHLGYAVSLADSNAIMIDTGEEIMELDCGEIYLFRASIYAVSAAMKMITLYDVDLFDENGCYDWIHDMEDYDDDWEVDNYYIQWEGGDKHLYLEYYDDYVHNDSLLFHVMQYNYENRQSFLKFRAGNTPNSVKSDLEDILADLQNSVDYISNETDAQEDDIIPIDFIEELNEDIEDFGPNDPNFTQNWETIDDVIDWVESILDGPYTFNEDVDDDGVDEEVTVNLSRLFNPGLNNLKNYVPYHNWLPEDEWVHEDVWEYWWHDYDGYYCFWCNGEWIEIYDVDYIHEMDYDCWVEPIEFLDDNGEPIDIDEEDMPYFPDYTLNGIFPGMDRDKWLELFGD